MTKEYHVPLSYSLPILDVTKALQDVGLDTNKSFLFRIYLNGKEMFPPVYVEPGDLVHFEVKQ